MRETRAQKDAKKLAALEAEQGRVDKGELSIEDANPDAGGEMDNGAAAREQMYQDLEAQIVEKRGQLVGDDGLGDEPPVPKLAPLDPSELAELRRKISFLEQEVNPATRRAQQLEREVETLREQLAARPAPQEGPSDYGLTDEEKEFDTVTSIAEKVNKTNNAKLLKQIELMNAKLEELAEIGIKHKVDSKIADHRTALTGLLGEDPVALFNHPKMAEWVNNQSDEEALALRNPVSYSERFVAGLLTRFKAEVTKGQAKREPSHGESAVPSRVAPDTVTRKDGAGNEPSFNPRTFQADVQKLISERKFDEANRLVAAADRAVSA
jgi:hypothetical protein